MLFRLALKLLKSALELRIGPSQILELEFHRTVFGVEIVDKVFQGAIPLGHLLDIQLRDRSLATPGRAYQQ